MATTWFNFAKLLKTYIRLDYLKLFNIILDVRDDRINFFGFIQFDNSGIVFHLDTDAGIFVQILLIFKDISSQKIYLISTSICPII